MEKLRVFILCLGSSESGNFQQIKNYTQTISRSIVNFVIFDHIIAAQLPTKRVQRRSSCFGDLGVIHQQVSQELRSRQHCVIFRSARDKAMVFSIQQ